MNTIERIFKLMEDRDVSQYKLAKDLDLSQGLLPGWRQRTEQKTPSLDVLIKIAKYFCVSAEYLLGIAEKPEAFCGSDYASDEFDLVKSFRQLTLNSKDFVLTFVQRELRHVKAEAQGETTVKIFPREPEQFKERGQQIKVFDQPAAAGFGNFLSDSCEHEYEMVTVACIPPGAEFGIRISGNSMEPEFSNGEIVFIKRQPTVEVNEIGIFINDGEAFCKKLVYKNGHYYLRSLNDKYADIPLASEAYYCMGKVLRS